MPIANTTKDERIVWDAYPSWKQFTWLYLFSVLSAFRGGLHLAFGLPIWEMWIAGAIILLICVAFIRQWAHYFITSAKVEVKNGYTGKEIDAIPLNQIHEVTVKQGLVAGFLEIGTVEIRTINQGRLLRLRGVKDPDVIKNKIDVLRPRLPETN